MSDVSEEQAMELEALQSIYQDDMTVHDGARHYEVRLAGGSDSVAASKVALALEVRVPSEYPAVVPEVQVRVLKGVSSRSALELQTALRDEAQRSLGAPMVFTLAQMLKDWLDEHLEGEDESSSAASAAEKLAKEKAKAALDLEFGGVGEGTPVTPENYRLWWENFLREREAQQPSKQQERRLTGRQYFAQSGSTALVAEAEFEAKLEKARSEAGEAGEEVDWALFEDEDLEALEDLDEEEESDEEAEALEELHYEREELEHED